MVFTMGLYQHAKGVYTHIRYKKSKNVFAKKIHDACYDDEVEASIFFIEEKTLYNKSDSFDDNARLDIKANNSWASRFNEILLLR